MHRLFVFGFQWFNLALNAGEAQRIVSSTMFASSLSLLLCRGKFDSLEVCGANSAELATYNTVVVGTAKTRRISAPALARGVAGARRRVRKFSPFEVKGF